MSLKTYHAKRNFAKTPEPRGEARKSTAQLAFVVQEHHARQLHYDFRLEYDGVLKSWAVPKGPSMNPHDRHLAIMTEDHPFEYRKFEGTIPEGNYGAGEVIIWDQGTYEPLNHGGEAEIKQGLKKGHVTFFLHGKKLHGEFALVRLPNAGDDAWLLIKKGDADASATDITEDDRSVVSGKRLEDLHAVESHQPKSRAPQNVPPMLATLIDSPFSKDGWLFELKWDGYRAIAQKDGKNIELYSRNGQDFKQKFAPIAEALAKLPSNAVLDGEIVAIDSEGRSHFEWLQHWNREQQGQLAYYVFDILWHNGHDLRQLPLIERKKILKDVLPSAKSPLRYSDHIARDGKDLFAEAQKRSLEGIVAKLADSPYRQGVRGEDWLKIKTQLRQETVIGGFTEPRGSRKYLGSLLLGVFEKGDLKFVGHSGGGIPANQLKSLHQMLVKLETKTSPFSPSPKTTEPVHWVKPKILSEVSFSEWTTDGRMRHPKFEGIRTDKDPRSVHMEKPKHHSNSKDEHVSLPGSKVAFSHLEKIFWPELGYTKGDLIRYYQTIGETMLRYLKNRPESLNRQPHGYQDPGFFQKDINNELPKFTSSIKLHSGSTNEDVNYLVANNLDSLLYMVQLGCIEINPWNSRLKHLDNPDWAVIDLDPEAIGFKEVVKTAQVVREVCEQWEIPCFPKTTGKTGIHIFIPLGAKYTYDQARQFAQLIAIEVNMRLPKITSLERSPDKRQGKVYLDYLQNSRGQTLAAAYSVRPTKDATVSMPLKWQEVNEKLKPTNFTIKNAAARLKSHGDLWEGVLGKAVDIGKVIKRLESA